MTNHKNNTSKQDSNNPKFKSDESSETTTTSLKRNVSFYSYKTLSEQINSHKNNGYDDSAPVSYIFSTLINTWLRSDLHLDVYLVLTNYIANIKTNNYSDLTPPIPSEILNKYKESSKDNSDETPDKKSLDTVMRDKDVIAMTLPANLYNELQASQYIKTNDISINAIYSHLILGWIKSGLNLMEYCSLMKYAQKLHLFMLETLKDYVSF